MERLFHGVNGSHGAESMVDFYTFLHNIAYEKRVHGSYVEAVGPAFLQFPTNANGSGLMETCTPNVSLAMPKEVQPCSHCLFTL